MLYFAYGSNLHHFQMKRRCKDSLFIKKINLNDFRLTFRSKYRAADIEAKKKSIVPGALYEISNNPPGTMEFFFGSISAALYLLLNVNLKSLRLIFFKKILSLHLRFI